MYIKVVLLLLSHLNAGFVKPDEKAVTPWLIGEEAAFIH